MINKKNIKQHRPLVPLKPGVVLTPWASGEAPGVPERPADVSADVTATEMAKLRRIIKNHTPDPLVDTPFDVINWGAIALPGIGNTANILTTVVPDGQILVIQHYIFFAEITSAGVPIIAQANEFLGVANFRMNVGGRPIQRTGAREYPILSQDLGSDANPSTGSTILIVRGGQTFTVDVVQVALPYRVVVGLGCRIRGFLTQEIEWLK